MCGFFKKKNLQTRKKEKRKKKGVRCGVLVVSYLSEFGKEKKKKKTT